MIEGEQQRIISQGRDAAELLKNDVLCTALDDMLTSIFGRFLSSQTDADVLVDLHKEAMAVKLLRGTLMAYTENGRHEEHNREVDDGRDNNNQRLA